MVIMMISMYLWSVGWPLAPQDSTHPIGNNYGAFQEYDGVIYLHNAIDVMADSGTPIYAVADGFVKAWVNTGGGDPLLWAMPIGDEYGTDSCNGWMYAHIDSTKYHLNLGDTCSTGELIGYVVPWIYTGQPVRFHHIHFTRLRSGGYPWTWVVIIQNPLSLVVPIIDTLNPVFKNAAPTGRRFAFCRDNTSDYLDPDSLTGDVDIIARIYDCTGESTAWPAWDELIPYKIEYRIHGPDTIPTTRFMEFSGLLNWDSLCAVTIFKNDATCNSTFDYTTRLYYFIVTNTDGDTLIEPSDTLGCWQTAQYQDGTYWVVVTAYDICGNQQSDSMQVTLRNETVHEYLTKDVKRVLGVYPTLVSPNEILTVSFCDNRSEPYSFELFNSVGQHISSGALNTNDSGVALMPLAEFRLSTGIYFFVIHGKDCEVVEKIIIIE